MPVLLGTADSTFADATLLDTILCFGAIVVAPMALVVAGDQPSRRQMAATIAAAAVLTGGLFVSGDGWAATMAVPWLLATFGLLWRTATYIRFHADRSLRAMTRLAAHGFLLVGAVWAIAACGGYAVMGFDPVIVQLTAIHFHYAGFALPVLALKVAEATPGRMANASLLFVLAGVPAVAVGIAARSVNAQVAATLILTAGCILVAGLQFRAALTLQQPTARTLLAVSAVSLPSGMALAVVYAVGQSTGREWINIPIMIKTHGVTNAFGFAFCGLMGWLAGAAGTRCGSS